MDDRMAPENIKSVAESLMSQGSPAVDSQTEAVSRHQHPDQRFAKSLFGDELHEAHSPPTPTRASLDLSALSGFSESGRLQEDLSQQAAQALARNQNDAFLAITQKMSGEEIELALKIARQWRRPEADWQDDFRSAPETGFRFIDQASGKSGKNSASKKSRSAESLVRKSVTYIRTNDLTSAEAPQVVRGLAERYRCKFSENTLVVLGDRVRNLLG